MEDCLSAFEKYLKKEGKRPATIEGYLNDLRLFVHWSKEFHGEEFNPKVTKVMVKTYIKGLEERGYKPSTINRKLSAIRGFFKWAMEEGILQRDPTKGVRGPRQVRRGLRSLSRAELNKLIEEAERKGNKLHEAVVVFLANTGLRASELVRLRMEDLEIGQGRGVVRIREKPGTFRKVPLNAEARRVLREYLAERPAGWDEVFVGQRGPLSKSGVYRLVKRLAERAGLKGVSPHTLRHTFGKMLVDAGVSLDRVAILLGHKSMEATRIYATPSEEDLEEAVERLV